MSIWSEIRTDYVDDENVIHVDAWVSEDDNEDGAIIALIIPNGTVVYKDIRAKTDLYAQEMIKEVLDSLNG